MCTSLFHILLLAVFHRVSPLQELRKVLANIAWQMQHLEGLIVKCFEWYKSSTHKCHLHCFRLVFEWKAIYCHASFASSAITLPPSFCIGRILSLHQLISYVADRFLHRRDISISCSNIRGISAWMRTTCFVECFNLMELSMAGELWRRVKRRFGRSSSLEC